MIDGSRIYLRPFTGADLPIWASWFNDPDVTEWMNKGAFPVTERDQAQFLEHLSKSSVDLQVAIVLKEGDLLVGTIGIHKIDWIHRHGAVSVVIGDKRHWGRGIGTEAIGLIVCHAFNKLNLHRLTAGMWAPNEGCRRCFERNGFRLEGTLREGFFYRGTYVDEYVLGLVRTEWEWMRAKGESS